MDMDETSTGLFEDLVTGRDNETFINGYHDSIRMAFTDTLLQCGPFRHLDSPSFAKDRLPVTMENLSNQSYDAAKTLPLLDDFRLDERDIASNLGSPVNPADWNNGSRGRTYGKRTLADKGKSGKCKVCGDLATGMYFGALVCVPCKTFFLRYEGDNFNFVCKGNKDCEITMATRTQCKYCRYQKCREAGMVRRVRPAHVNLNEGQQLCVVCHDVANGIHFGAITCEGCKKFFRRGLSEHAQYSCKNGQVCVINPRTRNSCRFCRYKTCLSNGMSREAIQMGRPSKLALESSGIQRGMRSMNSGSARNDKLGTPGGSLKEIAPHYLMGNHHPKEEPPAWDWQMDQTVVGHTYHPDIGNFAGQMTGVCDFLDSPAKRIGMEGYGASHLGNELLTPSCSSNGGGRNSSSSCMSHVSSASPEDLHYGNSGWDDMNIDVSKPCSVQSVILNALYHNSGGSVQQMNSSSYGPHATTSQELISNHALPPRLYHDKTNIPLTVNGSTGETLQYLPNSVGLQHPSKLGNMDLSQQQKLEHFDLLHSSKVDHTARGTGQMRQYKDVKDVLDSLLNESCQTREQVGTYNKHEHYSMKYNSETNFVSTASEDQQVTCKNRIVPETNRVYALPNVGSATIDGHVQFAANKPLQSEKINGTSCFQTPNESPSSTTADLQSQHGQLGYTLFDTSTEPSSINKAISAQCTTPHSSESNISPISTRSARDDAVVPMMTMSDQTKNNMDSIAEWVFQLQQSYVDNEEETPIVFLNEDLIKVCREQYVDGVPFEQQIERSIQYWKSQELPDENIMVGAEHWRLFNHFHPLYANYVSVGSTWNHNLRIKFEQWKSSRMESSTEKTAEWVRENVFPVYTDLSRDYFSQIQGFKSFDAQDQQILLRLAQSQSRILAAALAWFNSDSRTFTDFLPWRELKPGQVDLFRELLTDYAKNIESRNLDPVESALFNIVVVIATDYPGLVRPDIIESYRTQFLATFRAYTTAKYGTPNKRMEKVFQLVPQLRRLGYLHYAMTQSPNIGITTTSDCKEI